MLTRVLRAGKLCFLLLAMFLCILTAYASTPEGKITDTWASIKTGEETVSKSFLAPRAKEQGANEPDILKKMHEINEQLAARGANIAIEAIDFFTIGLGRPGYRLHQTPYRWVPGDPRRNAQGDDITYLVDLSDGTTASGLSAAQTDAAVDRAMATWDTSMSLKKVDIVERTDSGDDPDILDAFYGFGSFGNPFLADIVNAGWLPRSFFAVVAGDPDHTLAFSISFIFIDAAGYPSDINGDNYLDTALNEVYYNDTFGTPGEPRQDNPWGIDVAPPGVDVETIALHENAHSLGLDHFGPPPTAVMNTNYTGILHSPFPTDNAGMAAIWGSWPNP